MQAIENLTRLRGRILSRIAHPSRAGYDLLTMQVEDAHAVDDKADLLSHNKGSPLDVAVRSELLQAAQANDSVDLRAKMTPDGALAEPHPAAADFVVTPGI